jgi:hypothetical protein
MQMRGSSPANRKGNPTSIPSRWISWKISSFLTQRHPESRANALNTSRESNKSIAFLCLYPGTIALDRSDS